MKTKLSAKFWFVLTLFSLVGQIAWVVENMYLNVFIYKMFHASAADISAFNDQAVFKFGDFDIEFGKLFCHNCDAVGLLESCLTHVDEAGRSFGECRRDSEDGERVRS